MHSERGGRVLNLWNKTKNSIKIALKNRKKDWGNLAILLVPLLLAIPYLNKMLVGSWYGILGIIVLFLIGWLQSNSTNVEIERLEEENKGYITKQGTLNNTNEKLKSEIDSMENTIETLANTLEIIPELVVKYLSMELKLSYMDRISIYRYDFKNEFFISIGRYSVNPEYTKFGRGKYPKDKGFISNAWRNGSFYKDELPDFSKNEREYVNHVSQISSLDKGTIKKLSMKSRSYFCKNLLNEKRKAVGVIVLESTNEKFAYTEKELNEKFDGPFGRLLIETIESNLPLGKDE